MGAEDKKKITLFLIDVQKDFHPPHGSLAVPNADADAKRIAELIKKSMVEESSFDIDRIVCTMDSHNSLHIAHRGFWVKGKEFKENGALVHPDPFTLISNDDLKNQVWIPRPGLRTHGILGVTGTQAPVDVDALGGCLNTDGTVDLEKWTQHYTSKLEEGGKFQLIIWPEHCLIGTPGHGLMEEVRDAIHEWELASGKTAEFVLKGFQNLTEMFSVFQAEVPVCRNTMFNQELFEAVTTGSDEIWIAGQASSHCLNLSTRDLVSKMPKEDIGKVSIFKDCTSPVAGFEEAASLFFEDMEKEGVQIKTTDSLL